MRGHPGRVEFRGLLCYLDRASEQPPTNSSKTKGHCVYLELAGAKVALEGLVGMPVSFCSELDAHGEIIAGTVTHAEIVTNEFHSALWIYGVLWQKLCPVLVANARDGRVGLSFEIYQATVREIDAPVWQIKNFTFSGVSMLRRSRAAYKDTFVEIL